MSRRHVAVIAAGELGVSSPESIELLAAELGAVDLVIAADGGLDHAATLDVDVDVAVGDFDSVSEAGLASAQASQIEVVAYDRSKDHTDLELALGLALDRGATDLTVVAPFGGRMDHALANVALLAGDRLASARVCGIDGRRRMWILRPGTPLVENFASATQLSLIPWSEDVHGVTTSGLLWPLDAETLRRDQARGVSNEVEDTTEPVTVTVREGVLLAVVDRLENNSAEGS